MGNGAEPVGAHGDQHDPFFEEEGGERFAGEFGGADIEKDDVGACVGLHSEAGDFGEGFRDMQKGQFVRAMGAFGTARAIDKNHPLAERYYKLAEKQRDEMIADLLLEGRRYREKSMFSKCSAAFDKALALMPNRDDPKFKNAEALKSECDLSLKNRFRY